MSKGQVEEKDLVIEQWKIKRVIKSLDAAKGNGTSMITVIVPQGDDINQIQRKLTDEAGAATNIKSRVNRLSVISAIESTRNRLKTYNRTPPNGLVVFCGTVMTDDGKEKKVTIDFEPFKPINTTMYMCDNKFHTEDLQFLTESDDKYGFLVMDGNGALFGTVQGNDRQILQKISVDLPKKHGRGGQSAMRFARLRLEKRQNYVTKVAELMNHHFLPGGERPNVAGLVLAGSADFKNDLMKSDLLDQRLQAVVLTIVDVAYGGENGFGQAIELAGETLGNLKFIQEKKLLTQFMSEVAQDSGKYCFAVNETLQALEMGAIEHLIIFENLPVNRYVMTHPTTQEVKIHFLTEEQKERNPRLFTDPETNQHWDQTDVMALTEWLVSEYKNFGAKLHLVSDKTQEGHQFVQGFGGVGGLLRYVVNFDDLDYEAVAAEDSDDSDFM
mmetsp:Transcript_9727/g.23166  ORF Transcript_9727/g.23166 Transcript_9727/m.23166 type:complete len:442 (+) Transcript_9727:74-1399(+)